MISSDFDEQWIARGFCSCTRVAAREGSKEHVEDVCLRWCRNSDTMLFVCLENRLEHLHKFLKSKWGTCQCNRPCATLVPCEIYMIASLGDLTELSRPTKLTSRQCSLKLFECLLFFFHGAVIVVVIIRIAVEIHKDHFLVLD